MAFLDDNGLLYLWGKIRSAISDATSGLSSAWSDITGKPSWIGDSKPEYTASEVGAVPSSEKGTANGISGSGTDKSNSDFSACISRCKRNFSGYELEGGILNENLSGCRTLWKIQQKSCKFKIL